MKFTDDHIKRLQGGQIGVIPTDTIYGIACLAKDSDAIERIYRIKNRNPYKAIAVLISDSYQLQDFDIDLTPEEEKLLDSEWPGACTILLTPKSKFKSIDRGLPKIGFRIPDHSQLRDLIKKTGPLAATSVNPEGELPASNIEDAKHYFGDQIDFYVDEGGLYNPASSVIEVTDGKINRIR